MDKRSLIMIGFLGLVVIATSALWMFQGLGGGNRSFILHLRLIKLGGLLTVGTAIAVSTILFQTVASNRVLTPSIMGFDALYLLLQTMLVATLGISGFAAIGATPKFILDIALMTGFALALFGTLLGKGKRDIPRMILTGVILGVLFRSLSGLVTRLMDPNAYAVVQSVSFASFSRVNADLLPAGILITLVAVGFAIFLARHLDVMALGRDISVSLGLRYNFMVLVTLALVAVLVSVATALVGPVAFFGLIVAGMAHGLAGSSRHAALLPIAVLAACAILVGGQTLFERVLGQAATLSVVVEFAGGLFFLSLMLRGRIR